MQPIVLEIQGLDHVPSFKNGKMWTRRGPITDPKKQKWMNKAVASIESQLRSELATRGIGTTTGPLAPSLIASLLPLDDSRKWIAEHSASTLLVSKGNEGASITIERIA